MIVIFCSTGSWYKANWLLVHSSIVHLPSRFQLHFGDVNKASEREEIDGQNHGNENELRQCSSIRKFESTNEPKPSEPTLPTTTLPTTHQPHHRSLSQMSHHRRPLPKPPLPPIPKHNPLRQPLQHLIPHPLQTNNINTHKLPQSPPLAPPKRPHPTNFTEQMRDFFIPEAVICEVLGGGGVEGEG